MHAPTTESTSVCTSWLAVPVCIVPEGIAVELAAKSWAMVAGSTPYFSRSACL